MATAGWREHAACRGLPPDLFHPEPADDPARALAVCHRCSVKGDCLEYAVNADEDLGIWGGLTEPDRAAMRLSVARPPGRPGPLPKASDDDLLHLISELDPDQPAANQLRALLGISVPTAYKYLQRAERLGAVTRRTDQHATR